MCSGKLLGVWYENHKILISQFESCNGAEVNGSCDKKNNNKRLSLWPGTNRAGVKNRGEIDTRQKQNFFYYSNFKVQGLNLNICTLMAQISPRSRLINSELPFVTGEADYVVFATKNMLISLCTWTGYILSCVARLSIQGVCCDTLFCFCGDNSCFWTKHFVQVFSWLRGVVCLLNFWDAFAGYGNKNST